MAKVDLTGNAGAALERQAWMAKLKREQKLGNWVDAAALIAWGEGRTKRNAVKPGSLGSTKKSK